MERLRALLRSDRFREIFIYGVVGALTTAINYGAYAGISRGAAALIGVAPDHGGMILFAKIAAWILAVAFAFWANKVYVFKSPGWGADVLRRELPSFVSARVLSLVFDAAFVEIAVHAFGMHDLIASLISNVLVVILNYFASKFWIFRKR